MSYVEMIEMQSQLVYCPVISLLLTSVIKRQMDVSSVK